MTLAKQGNTPALLDTLQQGLELSFGDLGLWLKYGKALLRLSVYCKESANVMSSAGLTEKALGALQHCHKATPDSAEVLSLLAEAHLALHHFPEVFELSIIPITLFPGG